MSVRDTKLISGQKLLINSTDNTHQAEISNDNGTLKIFGASAGSGVLIKDCIRLDGSYFDILGNDPGTGTIINIGDSSFSDTVNINNLGYVEGNPQFLGLATFYNLYASANINIGNNSPTGSPKFYCEYNSGANSPSGLSYNVAKFKNTGNTAIVSIDSGSASTSSCLYFAVNATLKAAMDIRGSAGNGDVSFWRNTGSWYETMRICNSNGNVGIGETSDTAANLPASLLTLRKTLSGGIGAELSLVNYAASAAAGSCAQINFGLEASSYNANDCNAQIKAILPAASTSTDLVFSTYNGSAFGERLRLKGDGKFGVGINNPSEVLHVSGNILATGTIKGTTLIEKFTSFTPTVAGWYRLTSTNGQGGKVRISASYDNSNCNIEFQYYMAAYSMVGSVQQTLWSPYNNNIVTQVRISKGDILSYLDIYVADVTSAGVISVYGYGPQMPALIASPVVGAVEGTVFSTTLTLGHGFRSTSGAVFAANTVSGISLDLVNSVTAFATVYGSRLTMTATRVNEVTKYGYYSQISGTGVTNSYGFYADVTGATNNYGFYILEGMGFIKGNLGIGTITVPTESIESSGKIKGTQLISTITTGTAPLVVASTTVVANLRSATSAIATNLAGGNGTTLKGSIPYQSGTDTTSLLSPNLANDRKYLSSMPNGLNGDDPVWNKIITSDVHSNSYTLADAIYCVAQDKFIFGNYNASAEQNNLTGISNISVGWGNVIAESYGIAVGYANTVNGQFSIAVNCNNTINSYMSLLGGNNNTSSGYIIFCHGEGNHIYGDYTGAVGHDNIVAGLESCFIYGNANINANKSPGEIKYTLLGGTSNTLNSSSLSGSIIYGQENNMDIDVGTGSFANNTIIGGKGNNLVDLLCICSIISGETNTLYNEILYSIILSNSSYCDNIYTSIVTGASHNLARVSHSAIFGDQQNVDVVNNNANYLTIFGNKNTLLGTLGAFSSDYIVMGGYNNTLTDVTSSYVFGRSNTVTAPGTLALENVTILGDNNTIVSSYVHISGNDNIAQSKSYIMGEGNTAEAGSSYMIGNGNTANGKSSIAIGIGNKTIEDDTTATGSNSYAYNAGQISYASGAGSYIGESQNSRIVLYSTFSGGGTYSLRIPLTSTRPRIPKDTVWSIIINVAVQDTVQRGGFVTMKYFGFARRIDSSDVITGYELIGNALGNIGGISLSMSNSTDGLVHIDVTNSNTGTYLCTAVLDIAESRISELDF